MALRSSPQRVYVDKETGEHRLVAPNKCSITTSRDDAGQAVNAKTGEPIWFPDDEPYEVFWQRWGAWQDAERAKKYGPLPSTVPYTLTTQTFLTRRSSPAAALRSVTSGPTPPVAPETTAPAPTYSQTHSAELESDARAEAVGVDLTQRCVCCGCEMFSLDTSCPPCARTMAPSTKEAWWLRLLRWVMR